MKGVYSRILLFLTFIFISISFSFPIIMHNYTKGIPTGEASTAYGTIELTVIGVCGDGICDDDEDYISCPADCSPPTEGPGGGGGGGGATTIDINFRFDPDTIQEELSQGDFILRTVNVTNIGSRDIDIELSVIGVETFVFLDEKFLSLKNGEYQEVEVLISIRENTNPQVYLGEIIGVASGVEKTLPIVLKVIEEDMLIDVEVSIPDDQKVVQAGEEVIGNIKITNSLGEILVDIDNSIRDMKDTIIINKFGEFTLVPGENLFTDDLKIPKNTKPGYYVFYVNLTYAGKNYMDADTFRVEPRVETPGLFLVGYVVYLRIFFLIIILLIILYLIKILTSKRRLAKTVERRVREVDYRRLIEKTIFELNRVKSAMDKHYEYKLVERYFVVMRYFFFNYYGVKYSSTFEELVSELGKRDVKRKKKIISFINKVSHIPYHYLLISKSRFTNLIDRSIILVNSYKIELDEIEREKIRQRQLQKNLKKKKK